MSDCSPLRRTAHALLLVLSASAAMPAWAAASTSARQVDQLLSAWDKPGSPGVVVAVSQGGKLLYARGSGDADLRFARRNSPQLCYDVGSVSKQFTAYVVLSLVKQGKLKLDDDVRSYVPSLPDYGRPITVRELLQHTSGLRDYFELALMTGIGLDDLYSRKFVDTLLDSQHSLNFAPGTASAYTNTEYYLLAEIIERVTGESYPAALQRRVFTPLDMGHSYFTWDPRSVTSALASSYWPDGSGGYLEASLGPDLPGPSGLRTSALDLLKWEDDFDSHKLDADVLAEMMQRTSLADGRVLDQVSNNGIHVGRLRGAPELDADGGIGGFRAAVLHLPEQRLSVVVLANLIVVDAGALAEQVAAIYAHLPPESVAPNAATPEPASMADAAADLQAYAGEYHSDELDTTYDVCAGQQGLVIGSLRNVPIHLTSTGADGFSGDQWWFNKLKFTRDPAGRVDGLLVSGFRAVRDLRLERIGMKSRYCPG